MIAVLLRIAISMARLKGTGSAKASELMRISDRKMERARTDFSNMGRNSKWISARTVPSAVVDGPATCAHAPSAHADGTDSQLPSAVVSLLIALFVGLAVSGLVLVPVAAAVTVAGVLVIVVVSWTEAVTGLAIAASVIQSVAITELLGSSRSVGVSAIPARIAVCSGAAVVAIMIAISVPVSHADAIVAAVVALVEGFAIVALAIVFSAVRMSGAPAGGIVAALLKAGVICGTVVAVMLIVETSGRVGPGFRRQPSRAKKQRGTKRERLEKFHSSVLQRSGTAIC